MKVMSITSLILGLFFLIPSVVILLSVEQADKVLCWVFIAAIPVYWVVMAVVIKKNLFRLW